MPRITCSNIHCQYNKLKKCRKNNVKISDSGACTSYKAGFSYYFFYCAEHMQTNFLTSVDVKLHPEYKLHDAMSSGCIYNRLYQGDADNVSQRNKRDSQCK